jgi:pectate lyase
MNLNNRLRPPKIPYRMSPVSFWGPGLRVSRIQRFSREKLMFLPCLARVLAYMLSIGFLLGTARAAVPSPDPGREVLPANDGWGALPTASQPQGTTGGSNASPARTVTVTSRKELVAALGFPDPAPKLIYVKGVIDVNVDDAGNALSCKDYARPDPATGEKYSIFVFLAMFDPEGPYGRNNPVGGQEEARLASAAAQAARVRIRIPPNTTIFGVGADATLIGAWLDIRGNGGSQPMNVIVRNISFQDTEDCFPEWSPTDGVTGNWNSQYDSISVSNATHVWIDHNRFADLRTRDEMQPTYFGHRYQVHDGLLDITNESDLVTVSWNQFASHDKTMLIGNSDSAPEDREHLRVTLHHNLFDGVGQRAPRVRYGKVHVYNNVYRADKETDYRSTWGAGVESQIFAENNYFEMSAIFGPMEVIDGKKGTRITVRGNCWKEKDACEPMDLLAAHNARFDPDLAPDAGWTPSLYGSAKEAEPVEAARERVLRESGPGRVYNKN